MTELELGWVADMRSENWVLSVIDICPNSRGSLKRFACSVEKVGSLCLVKLGHNLLINRHWFNVQLGVEAPHSTLPEKFSTGSAGMQNKFS